jgi:hypothetical protein
VVTPFARPLTSAIAPPPGSRRETFVDIFKNNPSHSGAARSRPSERTASKRDQSGIKDGMTEPKITDTRSKDRIKHRIKQWHPELTLPDFATPRQPLNDRD